MIKHLCERYELKKPLLGALMLKRQQSCFCNVCIRSMATVSEHKLVQYNLQCN